MVDIFVVDFVFVGCGCVFVLVLLGLRFVVLMLLVVVFVLLSGAGGSGDRNCFGASFVGVSVVCFNGIASVVVAFFIASKLPSCFANVSLSLYVICMSCLYFFK